MKLKLSGKTIGNITACLAVTLVAIGVVFVFSAGAKIDSEYDLAKFHSYPEFRQAVFFIFSILILFGIALINYRIFAFGSSNWKGWVLNPSVWLVFVSIVLLVIVLIPGLGTEINYARRWLRIPLGPVAISFQPSELAKWSLVLFIPAVSVLLGEKIKKFRIFAVLCVIIGLIVGLIVIEDFGTAAFVAFVNLAILFIAGAHWWHFLTPLPVLVIGFTLAIISSPERLERIKTFVSPDSNAAQTSGYQVRQSLIAISTGGILGKGLGRGISKYGHLPEDTTDFIFAIIAEELGFVGVCFILMLFILFLILGIIVIRRCNDNFGKLLAFSIVFTITSQAAMNLGVVTRLLPTKGIALPFISAGGTHLLLTAAAVGILVSIARRADDV